MAFCINEMLINKRIKFVLIGLLVRTICSAQGGFYNLSQIQQIEINFNQSNWDYQMDTAKAGSEGYIMAASVTINGSTYDSVGVKYKGNSSYNATYAKNPLHIALDEFKNQAYQGYTDIKLGNGYADPSQIREVLSYTILKDYMDCPKSNFAQIYINGTYFGLFSNAESINKDFCSEHFYSSNNTFIKCNPVVIPGPTTKSSLKYKPALDSSAYFNFYEIKSDYGWNDLVALCDSVTNHASGIESIMDIDRVIWMLAFNNVLVNLDSYSGVFCQNYYLYKANNGRYAPVVWDLNMALGGFPFAGSGATGTGSLTVTNMQQMPLSLHATDVNWPLINAVLGNPFYKRMYVAHMRTIVNEVFANNAYQTLAGQLHSLVDTAMISDTNSFFNYTQFQNGLTTNYTVGSYTVPGISNLMSARVAYLQSTPEFSAATPQISAVQSASPVVQLNDQVTILATVTNASAVFLGYRFLEDQSFTRIQMFDDGLHNDGIAGDNQFGSTLQMSHVQLHYYIYAENSSAGIFSPERAEHEFYSLQAQIQLPTAGQLVINEFLANNVSDAVDENGNHSDWIEIYNNSNDTISLFGLYLSDSYTNPQKFPFPITALLAPQSYQVVWADDKNGNGQSIHCNFKLSLNGERLMLSAADSSILDSISYGPQLADVSIARCPNGTGSFVPSFPSTFGGMNCPNSTEEIVPQSEFFIFPNPAKNYVNVRSTNESSQMLVVKTILGEELMHQTIYSNYQLNTEEFDPGVYFICLGQTTRKLIVLRD